MAKTGEIIKKLRLEKGLTQEQLGDILGVQKSAIAKYENGRVENLKRTTIKKMAEYFGVSPVIFFDDEEENQNPNLDQWGDNAANVAYLQKDPDLLRTYLNLTQSDEVRVLFDKVGELSPEDVKIILEIINRFEKK